MHYRRTVDKMGNEITRPRERSGEIGFKQRAISQYIMPVSARAVIRKTKPFDSISEFSISARAKSRLLLSWKSLRWNFLSISIEGV